MTDYDVCDYSEPMTVYDWIGAVAVILFVVPYVLAVVILTGSYRCAMW